MNKKDPSHVEDFNRNCAGFMCIDTQLLSTKGYSNVLCYAGTCCGHGWNDDPVLYNPWDSMELLCEVMEKIFTRFELDEIGYNLMEDMQADGFQNALRNVVLQVFTSNKAADERMLQAFDLEAEEDAVVSVFSMNTGDPRDPYWQAANILVLNDEYEYANEFYTDQCKLYRVAAGHTIADMESSTEVRPFGNDIGSYRQLLAIEAYIRDPKNDLKLWEDISHANPFTSDTGTTLADLHNHRGMLVLACLKKMTEPFESEETKFTKQCMAIKLAHEHEGYCLDSSTFDPFNDMFTLSRIVKIVSAAHCRPFIFRDGDMMMEMRDYVTTFYQNYFNNEEKL